jgi:hypothetical protein
MRRTAFMVGQPHATALRALNYSRAVEAIRGSSRGGSAITLRDLVSEIAGNYGQVFTRRDCEPSFGVELLSQSDMFAAEPEGRVIRRDSMPRPENHEVHRDDVLIAGAGTLGDTELYGRAVVADARLAGKFVGPHAMVMRFNEPKSEIARFAYAFLCTRAGIEAVRSASYGTKVLGLRKSMLLDLPLPEANAKVLSEVATKIDQSVASRERYVECLAAARAPIEGLAAMQEAFSECAERRAHVGVRTPPFSTLNAWGHVSTGGARPTLERAWRARLGDVVGADDIFRGLRFSRVSCEAPFGVELLTQRDAFLLRPVPQRVVHPGFTDRWLFAPERSLLLAGAGTLGEGEIFGRVVYVSPEMGRYAVTEDMLRVIPQPEYAPVAYAFLSTLVGRRLLRSTAVGTKILRMRPDLLRTLPFPEVDRATVQLVASHLNAAMAARDDANRAEAEAIRIVEEEVLPAWLS